MALFTRTDDKNVPYLTRLVQVEPADYEQFFFWAVMEKYSPLPAKRLREIYEDPKIIRRYSYQEGCEQLVEVQVIAARTMTSLAKNSNVGATWADFQEFKKAVEFLRVGVTVVDADGEIIEYLKESDPGFYDIIPRKRVKPAVLVKDWQAVSKAWQALYDLWVKPELKVRFCSECENPYLVSRAFQSYCSNRCRIRHGMRESRRKKRESDARAVDETKRHAGKIKLWTGTEGDGMAKLPSESYVSISDPAENQTQDRRGIEEAEEIR